MRFNMIFKYKRELSIVGLVFCLSLAVFAFIKIQFFKDKNIGEPIDNVIAYYSDSDKPYTPNVVATTKPVTTTTLMPVAITPEEEDELLQEPAIVDESEYPYAVAPTFEDDGSIIYDGLTLTELTDKLNKSLGSYMTNTGYFFAEFTKDTGIDPYLSVAIVLLETGCKWQCSSLTVNCNNIGGLKGGESCNGGSYSKYDSLEEGIDSYLNIIYNNYYLKGMTTAETMASTYAASSTWASKVNAYIDEIKAK